jgi:hypothetical protein
MRSTELPEMMDLFEKHKLAKIKTTEPDTLVTLWAVYNQLVVGRGNAAYSKSHRSVLGKD